MMMYQGKYLYKWNWVGGGYNQVNADSKRQALMRAREIGKPSKEGGLKLVVDYLSLKRVKDENSFWNNYPLLD
jgi:hypothetical protein